MPRLREVPLQAVDELEALFVRGAHAAHGPGPGQLKYVEDEVVRQPPLGEECHLERDSPHRMSFSRFQTLGSVPALSYGYRAVSLTGLLRKTDTGG